MRAIINRIVYAVLGVVALAVLAAFVLLFVDAINTGISIENGPVVALVVGFGQILAVGFGIWRMIEVNAERAAREDERRERDVKQAEALERQGEALVKQGEALQVAVDALRVVLARLEPDKSGGGTRPA